MEHEKVIGLKIAGENHTALNGFIAKQQIEIEICMCKGKIKQFQYFIVLQKRVHILNAKFERSDYLQILIPIFVKIIFYKVSYLCGNVRV